MGKTTLLVHIARLQLQIPPNIDVLLCEQGLMLHLVLESNFTVTKEAI